MSLAVPRIVTSPRPVWLWLIGAVLLWSLLPLQVVDILQDLHWYAPNRMCDSVGVVMLKTQRILLPWAALALLVSALVTFPAAWKRAGGTYVFTFAIGRPIKNCVVSLVTILLCALPVYEIGTFIWEVVVPNVTASDCDGRHELVEITMRRSALQVMPLIYAALVLLLLYLRALALSPRRTSE